MESWEDREGDNNTSQRTEAADERLDGPREIAGFVLFREVKEPGNM